MSANNSNSILNTRQAANHLGTLQEIVETTSAATGEEATSGLPRSLGPHEQSDSDSAELDFATFDPGRKHLARVVAVNGKKVSVRRFNKKTGEWQTKTESRERKACIPLTAAEADELFPGSVAGWNKAAKPPNGSGGKVTRQMSRNSVLQTITAPAFQSVADSYNAKKKTIDDLTSKFVEKAGEAKRAQDDIIPHLAFVQSLLSKKGTHHHLVIEARKQGHKIPWWTDFYKGYKDRLWESLRTMERRIAAYRGDPTAPISKPERDTDPVPRLHKADRKALIEGNHRANALVAALEAGRDGKAEIASFKAVMDAKRLDDIVQAHFAEPDYKPKTKPEEGEWVWLKVGSQVIGDGVGFIVHSMAIKEEEAEYTTHVFSARLYSLGGVIHTKGEDGFPVYRGYGSRLFGESGKDYLYAENGEAPSCERCGSTEESCRRRLKILDVGR
jgi:hypothetical protein